MDLESQIKMWNIIAQEIIANADKKGHNEASLKILDCVESIIECMEHLLFMSNSCTCERCCLVRH